MKKWLTGVLFIFSLGSQLAFAAVSSVLVSIDGAPVLGETSLYGLQRVENTPCLLFKSQDGTYYLHLYDGWVSSPSLNGPWTVPQSIDASILHTLREAETASDADLLRGGSLTDGQLPAIYVAYSPSQIILTNPPSEKYVEVVAPPPPQVTYIHTYEPVPVYVSRMHHRHYRPHRTWTHRPARFGSSLGVQVSPHSGWSFGFSYNSSGHSRGHGHGRRR